MEPVLPGLYASAAESLPFAPLTSVWSFLLQRPQGNMLIYSNPGLSTEADAIADLGGVVRHYLNHWHEAMLGCAGIPEATNARIFCHEHDRDKAAESCPIAQTFRSRHRVDDDLEVIPTPGHTPGATAYLWSNGRDRCLFTGDTVFFDGDEWRAAVLETSDRAAYIESLELIKELDFNVLTPWAGSAGGPLFAPTDREDTRRRIDKILERVRAGDDH
jgi:glyoxylase-like metal-dependent hydrolase (beta-lactamase superfamily II)